MTEHKMQKENISILPELSSRGRFNLESWLFCAPDGFIFAAIWQDQLRILNEY